MRILCLSDTHGFSPVLDLDGVDLVVHCGDFCFQQRMAIKEQFDYFRKVFVPWADVVRRKCDFLFVWGNHEMFAEQLTESLKGFSLVDECCVHQKSRRLENGLLVYGTSYQPWFCDWAFNVADTPSFLGEVYRNIPGDTDILLTHCPPHGILDWDRHGKQHLGSVQIRRRVDELSWLKLHVFGHIHPEKGDKIHAVADDGPDFVNAALLDNSYTHVRHPFLVEIEP